MVVAIMAYADGHPRGMHIAAVSATVALCLLLTLAMGAYGLSGSLSLRMIGLDSSVNLVGLVAASLAGSGSHHQG